jgi:branched-chain amino acid transport system permease protein
MMGLQAARWARRGGLLAGVLLLAVLPWLLPSYQLILFETGLCFGIMGLGFNLLLRHTGLLSFGHGAYFAVGAYTVAMIGRYLPGLYTLELLVPAAVAASGIVAAVFGFVCVRHTRIFFSILTLALSMLVFALLVKLYYLTGGSDGIRAAIPPILGHTFQGMRRPQFLSGFYYHFLLGIFLGATALMYMLINSPFGKALQSVRDNEVRAEMIGIRVRQFRWRAFVISGMYAGLAGGLWSFVNGHVTPEVAHWVFSGEVVYMTLLGGFKTFAGPVVGAVLFTFLKLYAISGTEYWMLIIGATLIGLVLLLPSGIMGAMAALLARVQAQRAGDSHASGQ